jgi:hypothetical protein
MNLIQRLVTVPLISVATLCITNIAHADKDDFAYQQTNLVSDGAACALTPDQNLKNPWRIAAIPGGPFWISDNNSGLSTLYNVRNSNSAATRIEISVAPEPRADYSGVGDGSVVYEAVVRQK